MSHIRSFSPGVIELDQSTENRTKEGIRLDQILPSEIIENQSTLESFLKAYYKFQNMENFVYTESDVEFTDIILDGEAVFRISDPENKNNKFFQDSGGQNSTLVVTNLDGTTTNITMNSTNVAITNGNELPAELAAQTANYGKTFTVNSADPSINLATFNGLSAKLKTNILNYIGPGPSYVLNEIERHMDIDENDTAFLELMQKEIAPIVPRNVLVNKRTLYKQFIDFYILRGTSDSIEIFFRILFNDIAEVSFPFDQTLVPSSGTFDAKEPISATTGAASNNSTSLTLSEVNNNITLGAVFIGGNKTRTDNITVAAINGVNVTLDDQVTVGNNTAITFEPRASYLDNKGFLSDVIKIHDSLRFQKFSYVIKSGTNVNDWQFAYNRLVHPAGFKYFAEIVLFLIAQNVQTLADSQTVDAPGSMRKQTNSSGFDVFTTPFVQRKRLEARTIPTFSFQTVNDQVQLVQNNVSVIPLLGSAMPFQVPGVIGAEDLPVLVEAFASSFTPRVEFNIGKAATFSVNLNASGGLASLDVVDPGFGYLSAPTLTFNGEGSGTVNPSISLGALTADGSIDPDNITINSAGSNFTALFINASAPVDGSNNSVVGKIVKASVPDGLDAKEFTRAPELLLDTPLSRDGNGNLTGTLGEAKILTEPTSIQSIEILSKGSGYNDTPTVTFANPATHYTATPFFTEDFENASINNDYTSWRIIAPGHGESASHTASIDSSVADTGSKSLKIQTNGGLDTNASGTVGGVVAELALHRPEHTFRLTSNTVKIKVRAKKPSSGGASFFEMAYSTSQYGNSGWQRKTLTTNWADYEFEYDIAATSPTNADYVGFQGDGSNGIVYIDNVSITAKFDKVRAHALLENQQITAILIEHPGSGFIESPAVTISGTGTGASARTILRPTQLASISLTNAGSGYTLDPSARITTGAINEERARDEKHIRDIVLNHTDVDQLVTTQVNPRTTTSVRGRKLFQAPSGTAEPLRIGVLTSGQNWTITEDNNGANDVVEEHVVKVTNAAYKTIESNGYQGRKGGEFFNKQRLYDINYPIEFFSSQTIQNVESSIINNFNTNSFLNIE